jgi:hypothetical protein
MAVLRRTGVAAVPARCLAPTVLLHPQGNPGLSIAVTGSAG